MGFMSVNDIECGLCGYSYNPDQHVACQTCPLHSNCNLVCCPACGYQMVDPQGSLLVRLASFLPKFSSTTNKRRSTLAGLSLAEIPPGGEAELAGFSDDFPEDRKTYLQAYGLVLNHPVQVVQQSPVTIIRLDNIELALENDLARGIRVKYPDFGPPGSE
jgi:hypothetical protein